MADYIFFGEAFRWQPSEIDRFPWSMRKEIKETYTEIKKKQADEIKNQR